MSEHSTVGLSAWTPGPSPGATAYLGVVLDQLRYQPWLRELAAMQVV